MVKRKKVASLVVLMVLCQLTLTLFVGVWVMRQYGNEKDELKKELWRKFADTERQVTDSVIYHQYIEPLSKDTVVINHRIPTSPVVIDPMELPHDTTKNHKMVVAIQINDQKDNFLTGEKRQIITPDPRVMNKIMVGMKMLMAHGSGDSNQLELNYQMKVEADTVLFKKIFGEKTNGLGLNMSWSPKKDLPGKKEERFYFYSSEFSNIPAVDIQGYGTYLMGRIWPQVTFGALLVLLTATAFVIAYRSIRSQQQLHAIREDFISNISHELKTPLSTAKVTIEALKTFDVQKREEVMQEYLSIAEQELERLDDLVNKVLHTGMPGNANKYVQLQPVEINGLIGEVVEAFRARTKDKQVEIVFVPGTDTLLQLDALHVYGVLYNLLDNALKYGQRNDPEISINIEQQNNEVLVHVSDNGPGIHAQHLGRIFDKFFRVPSGNIHNVKGHGLGLSYSRQVMQQHGGKITVDNNPGEGCTFTLHFPHTS